MAARFKHDCEKCRYLGSNNRGDVYVCKTSAVVRYGDDGPEYVSTPLAMLDARAAEDCEWEAVKRMIAEN